MKVRAIVLAMILSFVLVAAPAVSQAEVKCSTKKMTNVIDAAAQAGGAALAGKFWLMCNEMLCPETECTSVLPCTIAAAMVWGVYEYGGPDLVHEHAHAIAGHVCDLVREVQGKGKVVLGYNHLHQHSVKFRIVEKDWRDDNSWPDTVKPFSAGFMIVGNGKKHTVKCRVKRDGKSDIHLEIHHVDPDEHSVVVYHKDGKYHLKKVDKDNYPKREQ